MNIAEKILSTHLARGTMVSGEEIGIRIDQTLTHDVTERWRTLALNALRYQGSERRFR